MADEVNGAVHPIFKRDPEELMQYLNKQVSVLKEDGKEVTGWVYTIDPVSETFVLLSFMDDKTQLDLIMGPSVRQVSVLDENSETYKKRIEALFRPPEVQSLSEEELEKKKNTLKSWLLKNRLPVQVTGNNGELLSISDALFIEPPYEAENCRSTNEIILGRIQGLIKNMPSDQEEWC
ncbi:gem-associated protein 6-like [Saccostrea echinata]|uniref:gem-associated protein 6-like n=1 Tax=Saccostrea echinata TaxID=191078 RepID=UPI002A7F342B|nr:gem-associated protein 6-like [Saccostrea echinata]